MIIGHIGLTPQRTLRGPLSNRHHDDSAPDARCSRNRGYGAAPAAVSQSIWRVAVSCTLHIRIWIFVIAPVAGLGPFVWAESEPLPPSVLILDQSDADRPVVRGFGDIAMTVQTIKAGAEDFLTKPVLKEKLLEVIGRALIRHEQMREQDTRIAALRSLLSRLTPREHEVFTLLVRGKPHKQIAYALGTSERTVKMHRHNVMQKFQLQSLAELAVAAERLGLLSVSDRQGSEGAEQAEKKSKPTTSNFL